MSLEEAKRRMRTDARRRLDAPAERDALSRQIHRRVVALPEYRRAAVVMAYIDLGGEVRTTPLLSEAWMAGKRIVVPYCRGDELELFALHGLDELAPGSYGIREPRPELREMANRRVVPDELELVLVPGLAFDRRGGRLGRGKGYYDRLLGRLGPDTFLVGLAFEHQMVEQVPMGPRDVVLDAVVTEAAVYRDVGRRQDVGRRAVGR